MAQISSLSKARNAADGLIWTTEGRFCALSGLRYVPLVVGQTSAANMPCRQPRKAGQMFPYKEERV